MVTRIVALTLAVGGLLACGPKLNKEQARQQVQQLMVLYGENRPKFVVQKQELEQEKSCARASALREAVQDIAREQAMSPERNETLTIVKMELESAENTCQAK